MPFSTIFQLYWWRKPEYQENTTDLSQLKDMSSGAIESWANGFPVLFTHWAKSHTGNSLYSNKMIFNQRLF
jgi:hypothetical protein